MLASFHLQGTTPRAKDILNKDILNAKDILNKDILY